MASIVYSEKGVRVTRWKDGNLEYFFRNGEWHGLDYLFKNQEQGYYVSREEALAVWRQFFPFPQKN